MIDIEIHGTGGRTVEARLHLLAQTRMVLKNADYVHQLTLVDVESEVSSIDMVQSPPFARVYAPPDIIDEIIADIQTRLKELFETLEGVQVIRVSTRGKKKEP